MRQKNAETIVAICVSMSEETFIVGTDTKQLYSGTLTVAELQKSAEQITTMNYLTGGFHSGAITGLSCAVRKPLVATSSIDKTVRVWNYQTNQIEFWKDFSEEVFTVSIHPNGHQILAGFGDKLRLLNILIDDFRVVREFPIRGCREVAFSNGGHLFAAVHGNIIQTFSSVNFEPVSNMKGHNGRVRGIVWSADDQKLISCGTDGAVYEWEVTSGKRLQENVVKGIQYTSAVMAQNGKSYATSADGVLREIHEGQILRTVNLPASINGCALSRSGKLLLTALGGTSGGTCGSVVGVRLPLTAPPQIVSTPGHNAPISRVMMNHEETLLFTGGEDGLVMVWQVSDREGRVKASTEPPVFFEEVLVTRSDLEEKNVLTAELRTRVEELKMENEYQLRLKDMNYNEKIKELTEKFIQEMESLKNKNQLLKVEKEKDLSRFDEHFKLADEKNNQEKVELEQSANAKLMQEYEKYQELLNQKHKMEELFLRKESETQLKHESAMQELEDDYEQRLADRVRQLEEKADESRRAAREHAEEIRQVEEDVDREVLGIKDKYERKLKAEFETNLRLKGEAGILRKKFSNLQREIEKGQEDFKSAEVENGKLEAIIRSLEKDITGLKHEIMERDETIQEKEKRIYDLKKKNQELEKFKFVLDYKIKELRKQIEPKEREIKMKNKEIEDMEGELGQISLQNHLLSLNIKTMRQNVGVKDREVERCNAKLREKNTTLKRIKEDIYKTSGLTQNAKELKASVVGLHRKYCEDVVDMGGGKTSGDVLLAEFQRQRKHLEGTMAVMTRKLGKDSKMQKADNVRIMHQNVLLIKEVNDLRHDLKMARADTHDLEVLMGFNSKNRPPDIVGDALAASNNDLAIVRNVVLKQQAEMRGIRDELFDQNMQMMDQLTKLAGMEPEDVTFKMDSTVNASQGASGARTCQTASRNSNNSNACAHSLSGGASAKGKAWRSGIVAQAKARPSEKSVTKGTLNAVEEEGRRSPDRELS